MTNSEPNTASAEPAESEEPAASAKLSASAKAATAAGPAAKADLASSNELSASAELIASAGRPLSAERPAPWAAYTTPEFWDDPHISEQMLAAHLNPGWDAASRRPEFIDQSVAWLSDVLKLRQGSKVLDLGCGPGLYANRLARAGCSVTGIDISTRSIAYASAVADAEPLPARFYRGNYLLNSLEVPATGYDAAILIFEDYNVLSPEQRSVLLRRIHSALAPGGKFVMDVTQFPRFAHFKEATTTESNLMGGFWAPGSYIGTQQTWLYPNEHLVLEHFTIEQAGETREFWNWMQCLTPEQVFVEFVGAGIAEVELFGDVAGAEYDPESVTFAVIATVPGNA
ncbi:MAG: methyltransferase domain-containing protein [Promicromonosporaceae bacterium]|nr:methyltransferase domain-containing protein [Promicromonosporaceae bacterium]